MSVFRCFTEKKEGYDVEAKAVLRDLRDFLGIRGLESVRVLYRYDVEGVPESLFSASLHAVFSEPQTDYCYTPDPPDLGVRFRTLVVEALPGQFDQRAESCVQCIELLGMKENSVPGVKETQIFVKTAKMYALYGSIDDDDMAKLRGYLINPVESGEAAAAVPETLKVAHARPGPVKTMHGFTASGDDALNELLSGFGLAMDIADLRFLQAYFRDTEKRDPTLTEIRVIDTYWSDHCRHTTFNTHITGALIDDPDVKAAYGTYLDARREVYGNEADSRPQTLMDIATIAAKVLRGRGLLANADISDEVNACSVHVGADVGGSTEDWLLYFKNETHNHPTEVEPFGGAATCIGGAIRDPLSGRAYVYQAMRITGSGDPRAPVGDTIPGKLPQRKLTVTAAQGYSSYGNQIGLATGFIREIYHPGFVAKRMELGAVVGAVKSDDIIRRVPSPGDKVLLLGGRTGRDGIGGATGSSKSHTADSLVTMASEVQKGNAPEERKIQRLFLDPEVTKMIKRCNDFGAGGVSVAVGELADGLDIDLSLVRRKYEGLDGTEIAISESQERMAVVVAPGDVDRFINKAAGENLEAYVIAGITDSGRMVMRHEGSVIVDLSRDFLSTNGAVRQVSVRVPRFPLSTPLPTLHAPLSVSDRFRNLAGDLRFCSQRGLHEMFDGTVGASSILMKGGGKTQSTPVQAMAALLPVRYNASDRAAGTTSCSVMAFGYDPFLSCENPFEGARSAVMTSVAKLVAAGCDPDAAYLTFQEYFEQLRGDPSRWGKPFSALLGAFTAQMELGTAAIGGKDSMSGSFHDIDVPPTLVSFAIAPNDARYVISPEFKEAGHDVVIFNAGRSPAEAKEVWRNVRRLVVEGTVVSAWAITEGAAAEGIFKMALGNEIGFEFSQTRPGAPLSADAEEILFAQTRGSIVAEVIRPVPEAVTIGRTIPEPVIKIGDDALGIAELKTLWEKTLEDVFPTQAQQPGAAPEITYNVRPVAAAAGRFAKPRALILTFPGTNSEIDTARAVDRAGGVSEILIVRNLTPALLNESIGKAANLIKECQMIIIPGGFSFGDEPDGSAKFIAAFFRTPSVADAVNEHLKVRRNLILGICNGFQALIKLGLTPFGEIVPTDAGSTFDIEPRTAGSAANTQDELLRSIREFGRPTLTHNTIGRHQAGYVYTRIASVASPWMSLSNSGDVHAIPISHGEGRFVASAEMLDKLVADGRIATQYTDISGVPSMDIRVNPNGSLMAVEGLFSPDGLVFGKMGHTERRGEHVAKNIYGSKHQPVFESGVRYFK